MVFIWWYMILYDFKIFFITIIIIIISIIIIIVILIIIVVIILLEVWPIFSNVSFFWMLKLVRILMFFLFFVVFFSLECPTTPELFKCPAFWILKLSGFPMVFFSDFFVCFFQKSKTNSLTNPRAGGMPYCRICIEKVIAPWYWQRENGRCKHHELA